ncbi:sulfatase-like hydrolase/transferase [Ruficoccus sp. ZRK36]|uniref:sulfatase family protein n=1 Tax=Ruficoccus sp. ZRK36 TaxID=2866311 RepID=UPI001C733552|nr:sulfatase-like hydrolase/transferase [Ruficoccus sp. ZRK36]QYY36772.1 sulfatase-like hydrolase/transferase [Ruficoccus sp. ZRK36]
MNSASTKQPNIIFMMADQLRWDFLGYAGADFIHTPNIDRLAAQSTRYSRAYSQHPLCVPARAALITGMHGLTTGILTNGQWVRPDYAKQGIQTWPQRLEAAGYHSAAVGKMHFYPWTERMGFGFRSVTEDKRWPYIRDDYYRYLRGHGSRKYTGLEHEGYQDNKGAIISRNPWELSWDHFVGMEAVDYLNTYGGDTPFAMMVGFTGPHCPYDPNEEFVSNIDIDKIPDPAPSVPGDCDEAKKANHAGCKGGWNGVDLDGWTLEQKRRVRQHYAGLVQQIDYEVGEILKALEAAGQLDNTLIIFTSDHGDYVGDHDMAGKGTYYEGSCHIPMIVRDPVSPEGVDCDDLVTLTDVTATMLAYAGVEPPAEWESTPLPKLPYMGRGRPDVPTRSSVIGALSNARMYLSGDWKYSKYATGEMTLFNLAEDPQEQRNRVNDPECFKLVLECEQALCRAEIPMTQDGHRDKVVEMGDHLWRSESFGREGYVRTYPYPWDKSHTPSN